MFSMYSLQIFVKLVPFITAHNSNIYLTKKYTCFTHIASDCSVATILGQSQKKSNMGSLKLCTMAACASNDGSFLVATHT